MITIDIKHNLTQTINLLESNVAKQVKFATAVALTKTAKATQDVVIEEMKRVFDRPTPFTLKSLYIKAATKQSLSAKVYLKNIPFGKNPNALSELLEQEFSGGTRLRKRMEKAFERNGYISNSEYLVPGSAAKLDSYGNLSRGQAQQVMSQLQVNFDAAQNKTSSLRSKRSVKKAGELFWSKGGRLHRGVWMRDGRSVKPILLAISAPHYKRLINLPVITQKVIDQRFNSEFKSALDNALRTAR